MTADHYVAQALEGTDARTEAVESSRCRAFNRATFLRTLFRTLEQEGIRYCVLHSYGGLPDELTSDLDMAVHPDDMVRLPALFRRLSASGYHPVQYLNYAVRGHYFVLFWFENQTFHSVAIDIIDEHRRGGFVLASGESLVAGRQKQGEFWVPAAATEFSYLLAKKILKGAVGERQEQRLCQLVSELGRHRAERVAGKIFRKKPAELAVRACANVSLADCLPALKRQMWRAMLTRNPAQAILYFLRDSLRILRRWIQPSGLLLCVLGPDGVGKSTLIEHLTRTVGAAFRRKKIFHWRPGLLGRRKATGPVTNPHGQMLRSPWLSAVHLFARLLDYWLGYYFVIRPLLARSGLVVFDRYFHDLLVDPKRYRYGGPMWLVRALSSVVAEPDVMLVLDAPEHVILTRKQEVPVEEVKRQRRLYLQVAQSSSRAVFMDASQSVPEVREEADRRITRILARRFQCRHKAWVAPRERPVRNSGRASCAMDDSEDALQETQRLLGSRTSNADPIHEAIQPLVDDPPTNGKAGARCYAVLPSKRSPRWLLPLGDMRATLQGLDVYAPYAPSARLAKKVLGWAIRGGWQGWPSHKILVGARGSLPLEELIQEIVGERSPILAMSLSRSNPFRKLTAQVMRHNGEILGYIKLPLTEAATARVRHEAEVLAQLWRFAALRPHIPRLLHAGPWGNGCLLFQSPGPSGQGQVAFGTSHREFLETLRSVHRVERPGHELVEEVGACWRRFTPRLDWEWQDLGQRVLEEAERKLNGAAVECGITHGDFAPWNTRTGNGYLFVFDWESASWHAPIQWDIFHFHSQVASLLRGRMAASSKKVLASWGSLPWEAALLKLYTLVSVLRMIEEGAPISSPAIAFRRRLLARLQAEPRAAAHPSGVGLPNLGDLA